MGYFCSLEPPAEMEKHSCLKRGALPSSDLHLLPGWGSPGCVPWRGVSWLGSRGHLHISLHYVSRQEWMVWLTPGRKRNSALNFTFQEAELDGAGLAGGHMGRRVPWGREPGAQNLISSPDHTAASGQSAFDI